MNPRETMAPCDAIHQGFSLTRFLVEPHIEAPMPMPPLLKMPLLMSMPMREFPHAHASLCNARVGPVLSNEDLSDSEYYSHFLAESRYDCKVTQMTSHLVLTWEERTLYEVLDLFADRNQWES